MFDHRVQSYDFRVDPSNSNNPTAKFISFIPRGSRVLEVGCANGALSAYLTRKLDCEVVGIELNSEAARLAERHCSRVIVDDVEKGALDEARGKFDVITFGDVLEHLVLPGSVLARCRGLLSKGGFVLVSVPNVAHYSVRLRLFRGQFDYEQYGLLDRTHLRFFTARTARRMLADSGYRIASFDIVCAMRGWRFVKKYALLQSFVKRRLTGIVGYQLIYKAVPCAEDCGVPQQAPGSKGQRYMESV